MPATVGMTKHTMCHENTFIHAIEPCRACYHTDHAASVATNSTTENQLGFCIPTAEISGALHSQRPPLRPMLKPHSGALTAQSASTETKCEVKQLWTLHCAGPVSTQAKAMRHWQLWPGGANLTSRASKRPPSASGQDRPSLHSTRTVLKSMWLMVCQSKQVCRSLLCCTCVNSDAMQEYHTRCCS